MGLIILEWTSPEPSDITKSVLGDRQAHSLLYLHNLVPVARLKNLTLINPTSPFCALEYYSFSKFALQLSSHAIRYPPEVGGLNRVGVIIETDITIAATAMPRFLQA